MGDETHDYPPMDGIFVSRSDVQRLFRMTSIAHEVEKCIKQVKDRDSICTIGSLDRCNKVKNGLEKKGFASNVHTFDGRLYHVLTKQPSSTP